MTMQCSYKKEDCTFLLKDLTGVIKEISVDEKEELIRKGVSYSEMISKEAVPSKEIEQLFLEMLQEDAKDLAGYVASVAELIYKEKGQDLVIVSLARAGTPYGILIKQYLKFKYDVDLKHYSISIIRGKGIDFNALRFILKENANAKIQFIDGWTGKGSIIGELKKSIQQFNSINESNVDESLAVIADPARLCEICAIRDDIRLANSVLNSTVSGLISRTIANDKFISSSDFHGAINIDYLKESDYSNLFVEKIAQHFNGFNQEIKRKKVEKDFSKKIVEEIKSEYNVSSIHSIKLSIGEASRVLIRRKAKLLILKNKKDKNVEQLVVLANQKGVRIIEDSSISYRAIAIIEEGL